MFYGPLCKQLHDVGDNASPLFSQFWQHTGVPLKLPTFPSSQVLQMSPFQQLPSISIKLIFNYYYKNIIDKN